MSKDFWEVWSRYGFDRMTLDERLQIPTETFEAFLREIGREDLIKPKGETLLDNPEIQRAIEEACQEN